MNFATAASALADGGHGLDYHRQYLGHYANDFEHPSHDISQPRPPLPPPQSLRLTATVQSRLPRPWLRSKATATATATTSAGEAPVMTTAASAAATRTFAAAAASTTLAVEV